MAQDLEAGLDARLDDVLEEHHPQQLLVGADQQRGAALASYAVHRLENGLGHRLAIEGEVAQHGIHRPLAILMTVAIQPAQPGLGAEGDDDVALQLARSGVALASQGQDGFALRRVVTQRGQHGGLGQQGRIDTGGRDQFIRHPVAEGDGAGLVQQQGAHVAGGLHRPARLGDHVELHQPVHAGDADGGEQTADGGRDQGDEQRQQVEPGHLGAVVVEEPGQGGHHQQEDQGQSHQQGVQRHLVGGLLALGPFHQRNHPIQGAFARIVADAHPDLVGDDGGVAGHAAAIGARLADDGGGLPRDGGLVDRGDAGDHFAVGGDHLAAAHQHQIALAQVGGWHPLPLVILRMGDPARPELAHARLQAVGPRLAAPLGQGLGEVGKPEGEPEPGGQLPGQ